MSSDRSASTSNKARFTAQSDTVEDRLKADTYGLVQLSDFRKRVLEAQDAPLSDASSLDERNSTAKPALKKRKTAVKKGGLSFGDDGDEERPDVSALRSPAAKAVSPRSAPTEAGSSDESAETLTASFKKRGLRPNAAIALQPKIMTKAALLRQAQLKDELKKEYMQMQDAIKATEIMVPFVFYDGKNVPGGRCRMKKGDPIWLFLERARKLGAGLADKSRRDWARISVDDLMVVKGDIIISHHYDFYYFLLNRTIGHQGPLFTYSAEPNKNTPVHLLPDRKTVPGPPDQAGGSPSNLQTAAERKEQAAAVIGPDDSELEGFDDDPASTKVVDRRWYERNKHIYPASSWEEFDATKDYTSGIRKDPGGNSMFFSR